MKPSSAIALVSAMPGLCCSDFSALETASLLAAQQTSKTATPAAANAPLCNIRSVLFIDPMACPFSPTAIEQPPMCTLPNRPEERHCTLVQWCGCLLNASRTGRGHPHPGSAFGAISGLLRKCISSNTLRSKRQCLTHPTVSSERAPPTSSVRSGEKELSGDEKAGHIAECRRKLFWRPEGTCGWPLLERVSTWRMMPRTGLAEWRGRY